MILAIATMSCQKETKVPDNVSTPQVKTMSTTLQLLRSGSSLRYTSGSLVALGVIDKIWFVYECPKTNSQFNPHKPNICVPPGTYEFTKGQNGITVSVPDVGIITYGIGESHLDLIPRGGVIYGAVINTYPYTFVDESAAAMEMLLNAIPASGTIQILQN